MVIYARQLVRRSSSGSVKRNTRCTRSPRAQRGSGLCRHLSVFGAAWGIIYRACSVPKERACGPFRASGIKAPHRQGGRMDYRELRKAVTSGDLEERGKRLRDGDKRRPNSTSAVQVGSQESPCDPLLYPARVRDHRPRVCSRDFATPSLSAALISWRSCHVGPAVTIRCEPSTSHLPSGMPPLPLCRVPWPQPPCPAASRKLSKDGRGSTMP